MSHGKACVTTPHCIEGLEAEAHHALSISESEESFATSVMTIIQKRAIREEIKEHAKHYIKINYSADRLFSPLMSKVQSHISQSVLC
jgi:hypothetical protein